MNTKSKRIQFYFKKIYCKECKLLDEKYMTSPFFKYLIKKNENLIQVLIADLKSARKITKETVIVHIGRCYEKITYGRQHCED